MHLYAHPCGSQSLSLGDLRHGAPTIHTEAGSLTWIKSSLVWLIWSDSLLHRTLSASPKHWDFQWAAVPTWYLRGDEGSKLWSSCLYGKCFAHWAIFSVPSYVLNWKTAFTMETTLSREVKQKRNLKGTTGTWRIIQALPKDSLISFGLVESPGNWIRLCKSQTLRSPCQQYCKWTHGSILEYLYFPDTQQTQKHRKKRQYWFQRFLSETNSSCFQSQSPKVDSRGIVDSH